MRVVVIGATGHVGGYLIPDLVASGHEVVAVSRNARPRYRQHDAWDSVEHVVIDRDAAERAGTFAEDIASLNGDVVVDMICFTPDSAQHLVDGLRGRVLRLIMCSTIWVKGRLASVPADEDVVSEPWGDYGIDKAAIEEILRLESLRPGGLRSTVIRPGQICGPGWAVINPQGHGGLEVWETIAAGEPVALPNFGLETLHHVHASDVAQAFQLAIERETAPAFDVFNAVAARASNLRGLAAAIATRFGREVAFEFVPFEAFRERVSPTQASTSFEHISRSQVMSIERARTELGYRPRYSAEDAVAESVGWLCESGMLSAKAASRWLG
ncbi:NAD-dependent epimerase/dehydratase family protein [Salinibacterium sp. G-O1]|uniref:NAD-dependent epimerase/dehydratase family protein n=1 Tax=Salinibacterium sp. G-O1 TaxID=3046208 RepID=UPI0024B8C0AD|nr:NAD-dependent epimerase/dehydratase family protein [Salinibacterium sp. G-O1]MDJ0334019.1 NAD-dependent epimerase/dehydratase family protein [Salinibacterium sp. G-O1]